MNRKLLTDSQIAFKAAVRRAIKLAGGCKPAAEIVRVDAPRLSRYGNLDCPEFAPVDVCFELDKAAGDHTILRMWADMCGLNLDPRDIAKELGNDVMMHAGGIAKEAGEVVSQAIEAAADGKLSPVEARQIDSDAADLQDKVVGLRRAIRPALKAV